MVSAWRNLLLIFIQQFKSIPYLFLEILLRYNKLVLLGTLGHPLLLPPTTLVSTSRKLWFLSTWKQSASTLNTFLRYYTLKNPEKELLRKNTIVVINQIKFFLSTHQLQLILFSKEGYLELLTPSEMPCPLPPSPFFQISKIFHCVV